MELGHYRLGDTIRKPGEIVSLSNETVAVRFHEQGPQCAGSINGVKAEQEAYGLEAPPSNKVRKFWMVHRIGSFGMLYQHPTQARAEAEAQRLARLNPDADFVVLEAVTNFRYELPPVHREILFPF